MPASVHAVALRCCCLPSSSRHSALRRPGHHEQGPARRPGQSRAMADVFGRLFGPAAQSADADHAGQRGQLAAQWTFQTGVAGKFEATPIVVDGVLYVTGPQNYAWAIDGRTGRQIWRYQRPVPQDVRACCGLVNRGFAIVRRSAVHGHARRAPRGARHEDRQGGLGRRDRRLPQGLRQHAGAAHRQGQGHRRASPAASSRSAGSSTRTTSTTGKRAWRFWTVPAPGEPGSETWPADVVGTRRRADVALRLVRSRDSTPSIGAPAIPTPISTATTARATTSTRDRCIALDADTRHAEVALPVHAARHARLGREPDSRARRPHHRRRAAQGRDGRQSQRLPLRARSHRPASSSTRKPFVQQTWAKEIGADGRPVEMPDQRPTAKGTLTCPDLFGGTNFMSPSFDPSTGLFYVSRARDLPGLHRRSAARWLQGRRPRRWAGAWRARRTHAARRAARDRSADRRAQVGDQASERRHGPACSSTAGGVVFSGTNEGDVLAADSRTGKELWRYQTRRANLRAADDLHDRRAAVRGDARGHDADGICPADAARS